MDPSYYREYYDNERRHWWFRGRERILKGQVERLLAAGMISRAPRILNIGAATGRSSEWLGEFGPVSSLEYDRDCCEMTRARTGLDIVHGSILALPFADSGFDLVCAFDVIEHVGDDRLAVAEMQRVTRSGGIVFVTVPAYNWLWSEHDDVNHHHRRYTRRSLLSLFSHLPVEFLSGFNSLLFPPIAGHRLLRRLFSVKLLNKDYDRRPRSDFRSTDGRLAGMLEAVFRSERLWLNRGLPCPFGVSIMLLARIPETTVLSDSRTMGG